MSSSPWFVRWPVAVLWLASAGAAFGAEPPAPAPVPAPLPAPAPTPEPPKPPPPPLPAGVVARVNGRDVPLQEFHRHLAERLRADLLDPKSDAARVLSIKIEEMVVEQETRRLGVTATKEDMDKRYAETDAKVRQSSGGKQTLGDLLKHENMPVEEFRHNLRMLVLKERIAAHPSYLGDTLPKDENSRLAQVEVVIGQLLARAKVEREGLPPGTVVRVNGEALTDEAFGATVDLRMRTAKYLAEYVTALVLKDLTLTDEALDASLARDRAYWERTRLLDPRPELQTLSYDDYVRVKYARPLEELRKDPYFRGLRALEIAMDAKVTDDEARAYWVKNAKERYGPSAQVLDIQVTFKIPNAIVEHVERRTREEAQRLIADFARRIEGGRGAKAVLEEIAARKGPDGRADRSVQAVRRTVRDSGNAQILFAEAMKLQDGQWSAPFETISEWHLIRRERALPAPSFDDAKAQVRQDLVVFRTNEWLSQRMQDPTVVQIAASK